MGELNGAGGSFFVELQVIFASGSSVTDQRYNAAKVLGTLTNSIELDQLRYQ